MKLQKATSFALLAVLELAADPARQQTAGEIAEKYGISAHHLAKVLRDLGHAGIVAAVRGVSGGYRFAGNAKRLTLMDVISVFEPIGTGTDDQGMQAASLPVARGLRMVLDEIDAQAVATFRSLTISTMLKLISNRPWTIMTQAARSPRRRARVAR